MLDRLQDYVIIGRQLADLHVNYEKIIDYDNLGLDILIKQENYYVNKMKFEKSGKEYNKGTIHFNEHITICNIPDCAYEYILNGKSAVE